jgi:hypothetical protein
VVYVAAEAAFEVAARVKAWKRFHGLSCQDQLRIWRGPVSLIEESEVAFFYDSIAKFKPRAIFFDPLAQCFTGGDESSAKDMGVVTGNLNKLADKINAAICVVHHPGWDLSRERGSSALRGTTRMNYQVSRAQDGQIKFSMEKRNSGKRPPPRYFGIQEVDNIETQTVLVPAAENSDPSKGLNPRQVITLSVLAMSIFEQGGMRGEIAGILVDHKIPKKSGYKIITSLIDLGLVENGKGPKVKISEAGKAIYEEFSLSHAKVADSHAILTHNLNWILTQSQPILTDSQPILTAIPSPSLTHSHVFPPLRGNESENRETEKGKTETIIEDYEMTI